MEPLADQTQEEPIAFDFSAYPADTLFLDRRTLPPRPETSPPPRARKERRRRVDPTTFEKQYTEDEIEFMNAVQDFKVRSGKMFPSHGDILRVALTLGYRKSVAVDDAEAEADADVHPIAATPTAVVAGP